VEVHDLPVVLLEEILKVAHLGALVLALDSQDMGPVKEDL
jgi:hypothetical protein